MTTEKTTRAADEHILTANGASLRLGTDGCLAFGPAGGQPWEARVLGILHYYYAPLCQLFRPGMTLVRVEGVPASMQAVAAQGDGKLVAVILNRTDTRQTVRLTALPGHTARRLRVHPDTFPATDGDLPLESWETVAVDAHAGIHLELLPREATIVQFAQSQTTARENQCSLSF